MILNLTPEDLSMIDDNGNLKEFVGKMTVAIGGAQPDDKILSLKKCIQGVFQV